MLDHIFLTVSDIGRSIAFYERVLPILGITARLDYDGRQGPAGHHDLKGFGANGRMFFWLRQGTTAPAAVHVGFVADSEAIVDAAHAEALAAGATEIHAPGAAALLRSPLLCGAGQGPGRLQPRIRLQELAARGLM